jgi:hypothetical protein
MVDGEVVGGYNTYDDVLKTIMKTVPDYKTEVEVGSTIYIEP